MATTLEAQLQERFTVSRALKGGWNIWSHLIWYYSAGKHLTFSRPEAEAKNYKFLVSNHIAQNNLFKKRSWNPIKLWTKYMLLFVCLSFFTFSLQKLTYISLDIWSVYIYKKTYISCIHESVCKGEGKTWEMTRWTFCQSHSRRPIRFVSASLAGSLQLEASFWRHGLTLAALWCATFNKAKTCSPPRKALSAILASCFDVKMPSSSAKTAAPAASTQI